MFCSQCGNKLDDNNVFCPQCGTKVVKEGNSSALDFRNMEKGEVQFTVKKLKKPDLKKCLCGMIFSMIMIILFGSMTVKVFHPAEEVEGEIIWVGEIYTNDTAPNFWDRDYYQSIGVAYEGYEWSGDVRVLRYDFGCEIGDEVDLYLIDGELTNDESAAEVNAAEAGICILLLAGSICLCGWFLLQCLRRKEKA